MVSRPIQTMPDDVATVLAEECVRGDYDARPAYQRNDYLSWIARAKTDVTRERRIAQMVEELRTGGVYMGMVHAPSRKQ